MIHVCDVLPTVLRLAGVTLNSTAQLDGIDQWDVISDNVKQVRDEIVEFDNIYGFGFFMLYPFKLVDGRVGYSDFLSKEYENNDIDESDYPALVLNSTASKAIQSLQKKENYLTATEIIALREKAMVVCSNNPVKKTCEAGSLCLFNIFEDPCEENDLKDTNKVRLRTKIIE